MTYRTLPFATHAPDPISQMAQAIAAARNLQDVFRAVFVFAARTTPADAIFVALYVSETERRRCVYAANLIETGGQRCIEEDSDLSVYPEVPLNEAPQSRAILTGEPVLVDDYDHANAKVPRTYTGSDVSERPPRACLAIPFGAEGGALGAIEVQSTTPYAFADAHLPGLTMAAKLAAIAVRILELLERERAQHETTLRALSLALEYRDYETKGHTDRVVLLSLAFGRALGLPEEEVQALRWGAYLHDLGKVAISDRILLKPGKLSDEELAVIRRHTLIGIDMCRDIPFLSPATRAVVRSHHERWDGDGYPDGLAGERIPRPARMFSLVDVYDALTSERPYKRAWSHDEAVREIREQAGRQFDPELVPTFLDVVAAAHREEVEAS